MLEIWQIIERVTYIVTLIGLPYLVLEKLKRVPKFSFDFSGQAGTAFMRNGKQWYRFDFHGVIRNHSLEPNTIQKIYLVVWRNKSKSDTKRLGYGTAEIKDLSGTLYKLPLRFEPRDAKDLQIMFESQVEGTPDEKILSDLVPVVPGSHYFLHRDNYELAFEDVNGNLFDQKGQLLSLNLINLNWTLENTFRQLREGKFTPFLIHKLKICAESISLKWRRISRSLGI